MTQINKNLLSAAQDYVSLIILSPRGESIRFNGQVCKNESNR